MRYIDRQHTPPPPILVDKGKRGRQETAHNIKVGRKREWDKFKFEVYRDESVKSALRSLFMGKCAYCESRFLHVYPGDVEHFRPKGRIAEVPTRSYGYYWLAASWDNLLLSCRNCNQKLRHEIHGLAGRFALGKMDQFPLESGAHHVAYPGSISEEENYRLLINPCIEDPEGYFTYDTKTGVIKAKRFARYKRRERAEKSISVYVLQRVPLVQAREKLLVEIHAQERRVSEAIERYQEYFNSTEPNRLFLMARAEIIIKREFTRLKKFCEPTEEYSAMAKQRVSEFLNGLGMVI